MLEKSKDYELGFEHGLNYAKEKLKQELEYLKNESKEIIVKLDGQQIDKFRLTPNGMIRCVSSFDKKIPHIEIQLLP